MVLLQHFSTTAQSYCVGYIPSLAPHGYMAVDFFFILSGFIMAYTYQNDFQSKGLQAYFPFLLKRIARVSPLGWVVTIAILAFGVTANLWGRSDLFINENAQNSGLGMDALINFLQIQGFLPLFNLNPPSWSISFEFGAYLLFPIYIYLIFNSRILLTLVLISGFAGLTAIAHEEPRLGLLGQSTGESIVRSLIEFALGLATYRLFRNRAIARSIGSDAATWSLSALCLALFALRVDLLLDLVFPLIVLSWARNEGTANRFLSAPIPYFLGTISFSIYLVHNMLRKPELEIVKHFTHGPLSVAWAVVFVVVGCLTVLPVATLSYYLVEHPGRDAINSLVRRTQRKLTFR